MTCLFFPSPGQHDSPELHVSELSPPFVKLVVVNETLVDQGSQGESRDGRSSEIELSEFEAVTVQIRDLDYSFRGLRQVIVRVPASRSLIVPGLRYSTFSSACEMF